MALPEGAIGNRLLAALTDVGGECWRRHLVRVDLKLGQVLSEPGRAQRHAYFPTSAIVSLLYLCSATLKRYEAEGRQAADAPLLHWAIWDAMFKMQNAFEGVISVSYTHLDVYKRQPWRRPGRRPSTWPGPSAASLSESKKISRKDAKNAKLRKFLSLAFFASLREILP